MMNYAPRREPRKAQPSTTEAEPPTHQSDAVVEATARYLFECHPISKGHRSWDEEWGDDRVKQQFRSDARGALHVTLPSIAAVAWQEGYNAGWDDAREDWGKTPNPHLSQIDKDYLALIDEME